MKSMDRTDSQASAEEDRDTDKTIQQRLIDVCDIVNSDPDIAAIEGDFQILEDTVAEQCSLYVE